MHTQEHLFIRMHTHARTHANGACALIYISKTYILVSIINCILNFIIVDPFTPCFSLYHLILHLCTFTCIQRKYNLKTEEASIKKHYRRYLKDGINYRKTLITSTKTFLIITFG